MAAAADQQRNQIGTTALDLLRQLSEGVDALRGIDADMNTEHYAHNVENQFDIVGKLLVLVLSASEGKDGGKFKKTLSESKCVGNLKILGSDKS